MNYDRPKGAGKNAEVCSATSKNSTTRITGDVGI